MSGRCLMLAGVIVIAIGVAVALPSALQISRHWTPVLVGIALFTVGAIRWAIADRDRS